MSQKLNSAIAVIGIDIGKNSFHIVGHDQRGAIVLRQKWSRGQVETRLVNMPRLTPAAGRLPEGARRLPLVLATPAQGWRTLPRRLETSSNQGAEWKRLISKYIGTMPASGPAEQSKSGWLPPKTLVSSAMIAKVGVAARHSHLAMPRALAARSSSQLAPPVELAG
jgi:hypothetical protein